MTDDIALFELRSYHLLTGMEERFAEHVRTVRMPIYARLGWRCDGFWTGDDDPTRVYYLLRWTSLDERAAKRAALAADPEWRAWRDSHPEPLVDDFRTTVMTRAA
ncbi:NIPSNAP family protein [Cnuibacter physcomitrellae]|uniref:NIPSNAP family protein n=1 Tax=Cnuibacter physcomitrellae TaxID=1619308 RepID=UPI002176080E|nr:NIPSNAP family protein [Cnuibacter physcomitrellae]MCS5498263.1 NIPSNAP family protein [Cnuibacter physcomitrellae]